MEMFFSPSKSQELEEKHTHTLHIFEKTVDSSAADQ